MDASLRKDIDFSHLGKEPNGNCPTCGLTIPLGLDECPDCPPPPRVSAVPLALVLLLLCSSVLMLGTSYVNVVQHPVARKKPATQRDLPMEAYATARQLVADRHPRAHSFSDFQNSPLEQTGSDFSVIISVEDRDASGSPVRSFFRVDLAFDGEGWQLKQLRQ